MRAPALAVAAAVALGACGADTPEAEVAPSTTAGSTTTAEPATTTTTEEPARDLIAEAMRLRSGLGLRADRTFVEAIEAPGNALAIRSDDDGRYAYLAVTAEEAAVLDIRFLLQTEAGFVGGQVHAILGDADAGSDLSPGADAGGVVTYRAQRPLTMEEQDAIRALYSPALRDRVQFVVVEFSQLEMSAAQARVSAFLEGQPIQFGGTYTDVQTNSVVVMFAPADPALRAEVRELADPVPVVFRD